MSTALKKAVQAVAGVVHPADRPAYSNASPSRQGKKGIVVYVDQASGRELRRLALDLDTTVQALGEEAFRDLLAKHGRRSLI